MVNDNVLPFQRFFAQANTSICRPQKSQFQTSIPDFPYLDRQGYRHLDYWGQLLYAG